jgi:hypothetical protein
MDPDPNRELQTGVEEFKEENRIDFQEIFLYSVGVFGYGTPCGSVTFWFRFRIRGSVPLTNGYGFGSGSCYFCQCTFNRGKKFILFSKYFGYYLLFEVTFTQFFRDKNHNELKRSHERVGIKVFFMSNTKQKESRFFLLIFA